ncbi:hypothetical protein [Roseofilum capinflatum]|uniref:Uncharacterized protein n=1 Tax=Roseofilum capinflatum BLCC-M114 TaxID=3022440 RepID=A0ABT7B4R9_9CYAN|nr:hypothetical protein [Roseofilum capinflatum]MDJ1174116.1 hypothetical protein [Roseofilum capinflatum BLCC-M114]
MNLLADENINQLIVDRLLIGLSNEKKVTIIANAIAQYADQLPGAFTVISPTTIRIRKMEK